MPLDLYIMGTIVTVGFSFAFKQVSLAHLQQNGRKIRSILSLTLISPLPSKTVPSWKYTTRESQNTYSSSSRVQVGCWRTWHRSFIPLSSSLFPPRSKCTKLLLISRAVERNSLPTGVKKQHRNLQGSTEWVKMESSLPPSAGLICSPILSSDLLLPACPMWVT